ncbi:MULTISPECIES: AAA domain-containing protein [unclassified Pseudofrankia]|uniref:AAA domain-containing protein n=1 Tax=unclassified Pseudofrankia TaxID=2994372 RepID=UPI0008D97049|nr:MULTISPECIES: AAA domain-containing protein [unclassified Pseudofrankia]MDT3445205.1 AAA domain-containing protein [Pseudofrankia sp. BMG5.37]OHV63320.1 hypothetical protein BCD48_04945 [Pseudofrankia sp. BMG5.36]
MLRSMLEALVRPSWVEQVTAAAQTLVPPDRRDRPRPRPVAQARRVDDGVYAVSTARGPIGVDTMIDLHLAPREPDASDRMAYRVTAVEEGRSELRVRVAPHAPHTGLWLWGTARAAGYLERNLVECWKNLGDPGLASQIVDGILTPILSTVNRAPGLSSDQARAYHACTTSGEPMVWGPPGTGKTTVLARAIDALLTRGKRVLLVSATNIAVDNALLGVVVARDPPAGELVRVGPPALARIAQAGGRPRRSHRWRRRLGAAPTRPSHRPRTRPTPRHPASPGIGAGGRPRRPTRGERVQRLAPAS